MPAEPCDPVALNTQEQITLRRWQVFSFLDKDRSGTLSFDEYFASLPMDPSRNPIAIQQTYATADRDGSGDLSFAEWNTLTPTRYFIRSCPRR